MKRIRAVFEDSLNAEKTIEWLNNNGVSHKNLYVSDGSSDYRGKPKSRYFTSEANRVDTITAISTNSTVYTDYDYTGVGMDLVPFTDSIKDMIKGDKPTGISGVIMKIADNSMQGDKTIITIVLPDTLCRQAVDYMSHNGAYSISII